MGRNISVVRDGSEKPYLGGYRNKNTGTVFHNACAQTQSVKEAELPKPRKERFCREAQTVDMKGRSTQSKREFGTQMPRPDLLLDTSRDRVVTVGSYFTATELEMHVPPCLYAALHTTVLVLALDHIVLMNPRSGSILPSR